jgi:hypothetical protein
MKIYLFSYLNMYAVKSFENIYKHWQAQDPFSGTPRTPSPLFWPFLGSVLPPICDSVCLVVRMSGCNNNFSPVRLYSLNLPPDARVAPGSCTVQYKQLIISVSVSVQRLE